jgi:hypothetical protein
MVGARLLRVGRRRRSRVSGGILILAIFLLRWLYARNQGKSAGGGSLFSPSGRRIIRVLLHVLLLLLLPILLGALAEQGTAAIGVRHRELGKALSVATAILVLPISAWLVYIAPHWLAWRILGPAGFVRLARAVLWSGPHPVGQRAGAGACLSASFAVPDAWRADPWTVLALAVCAEREGEPRLAETLLAPLLAEDGLPRRLRTYGLEIAARHAAARGDRAAVARRAAAGRGRGARLLRLLARAHQEEPPQRSSLLPAWGWAAGRRASRGWIPDPSGTTADSANVPAAPLEDAGKSPFESHLGLLAAAATCRPFTAESVIALSRSWERRLTPGAGESFEARGRALGVRALDEGAWAIRHSLVAELELLAATARGDWPAVAAESLAGEVQRRGCERLLAGLSAWTAGFPESGGIARPLEPPLAEWQSWAGLRMAVERLRAVGGPAAVQAAWYGEGLRLTACNWPVHLGKVYGVSAFWACHSMHRWSAHLAGSVADAAIALRSSENAEITRRSLAS